MKLASAKMTIAALCAALLLSSATAASALPFVGFNLRGGQYTDVNEWFLGGGADLGAILFKFSPNFEYVFVDNAKLYTLNLDVTYTVLPLAAADVWAGAGYVVRWVQPDGGDTVSQGGINLLAGAGMGLIPLKPFAQLKYSYVSGDNEFVWMLGARF